MDELTVRFQRLVIFFDCRNQCATIIPRGPDTPRPVSLTFAEMESVLTDLIARKGRPADGDEATAKRPDQGGATPGADN